MVAILDGLWGMCPFNKKFEGVEPPKKFGHEEKFHCFSRKIVFFDPEILFPEK